MILNAVTTSVTAQLNDQAELGVHIVEKAQVPEAGPANGGVWWRIPNVTAVFADLKGSTALSTSGHRADAAIAYTYFIRAMAVIFDGFSAGYVDIQGDGIFGLFSGRRSEFLAAACAITMRTQVERAVAVRFKKDASIQWDLTAGIGVDRGTLLVRQLGLRGTKQNEVWAGKPVNVAAKLSSVAGPNQVVVSDRVFAGYEGASKPRQRALIWSCGCSDGTRGAHSSASADQPPSLWAKQAAPKNLGLDFGSIYGRKAGWCKRHGTEFCEAIVAGKNPAG